MSAEAAERAVRAGEWPEAEHHLAELTAGLRADPDCLSAEGLGIVSALVRLAEAEDAAVVSAQTEALRCLRNAAAVSAEHRQRLAADRELIGYLAALLRRPRDSEPRLVAARCAVQLLGNMVSAGQSAQTAVWEALQDQILELLSTNDEKLPAYAATLMFNTVKGNGEVRASLQARPDFGSLVSMLLMLVTLDSEFALFCVEELCAADFVSVYRAVSEVHYAVLLDLVLVACEAGRLQLPAEAATFLSERFLTRSQSPVAAADPIEMKKILELLGVLSAEDRLRPVLQKDDVLLEAVVRILREVHELSKEEGTAFSTLGKLAELERTGAAEELSAEPTFGLKAQLVRLLGNLVWRRPSAQHAARRCRAIPVVLECCNLDARNPLLQQWAVVAVRNLCELCPENQREISELKMESVAPAAAEELRRMGMTTVTEAGRIRVQSVPPGQ
ncbi:ataxin-10-like [Amphibalanus amphitrite]|uniref:ataxin-10-like n=1 Tax=Amphibalanus amphitrite TaxID=1232801 RepID=UPI001C903A5D|nr:ataxin-10-like [Amphibalanus amphitrite]